MKKLYFEGAGMFGCRDTAEELRGNCRLRTMFHDDKGRAVYLEILSGMNKTAGRLYVDSCHYIGKDDYKMLRLPVERDGKRREYTPEGILARWRFCPAWQGIRCLRMSTTAETPKPSTCAGIHSHRTGQRSPAVKPCTMIYAMQSEPPGSSGHVLACGPCRIARTCAGIICRAPESTARSSRRSIWQASNKPNGAALR